MTHLTDAQPVSTSSTTEPGSSTDGDRIDTAWLGEYLLGTWGEARKHSRELLKDPAFHRIEGLGMDLSLIHI